MPTRLSVSWTGLRWRSRRSAADGIPIKTLTRAKRKGCPALRHNRVRLRAIHLDRRFQSYAEEVSWHTPHSGTRVIHPLV